MRKKKQNKNNMNEMRKRRRKKNKTVNGQSKMRKSIYIYMTMNGYKFDKKWKDQKHINLPSFFVHSYDLSVRPYELSLVWMVVIIIVLFCFCSNINRVLMQSKMHGFKTAIHIITQSIWLHLIKLHRRSACEMLNKGEMSETNAFFFF